MTIVPQAGTVGIPLPLPRAIEAQRLRWRLRKLYDELNAARTVRGDTWEQTANRLQCTPSQLKRLRAGQHDP